jgi:hypothetical protein
MLGLFVERGEEGGKGECETKPVEGQKRVRGIEGGKSRVPANVPRQLGSRDAFKATN